MVDLDTIFRSIINFRNSSGKDTLDQKDLLKNFRAMQKVVPIAPEEKSYSKLYHFILNYIKNCTEGPPELPSYDFIRSHFESIDADETVLALVEKIKVQQPYLGQDYRMILKSYNDDQNLLRFERVLSNSNKIASSGLTIGKGSRKKEIKGVMDAISYLARETRPLQRDLTGIKTEGQIISPEDSQEVLQEYNRASSDPLSTVGISTWIKQIDESTEGIKNSELWIVAAFTGHCKTTFSYNMAYRAIFGGWNVAYVTLEMSYTEIRRHLYVLHSCNPIFKEKYPEYSDLVGKITYNNVEYGRLNDQELKYWTCVCNDFDQSINGTSESYGKAYIWQPQSSSVTSADIEMQMRSWQQELQAENKGDLDMGIIDYISLMGATDDEKSRDGNETTNNIIKSLKRMTLTFNNGKGIRVISPHQINRAGFKEALENEGRYYLTALSNNHEAERSADVVISIFKFDAEGENNKLRLCNLKRRRFKPFDPLDVCIDFETGFIFNFAELVENASNIDIAGIV